MKKMHRSLGSIAITLLLVLAVGGSFACKSKPDADKNPQPPTTETPAPEPDVDPEIDYQEPEPVVEETPLDKTLVEIQEKYFQDVFYDFDKYDLSAESRETLSRNASFMKDYPTVRVTIEGHCDERGTREYNLALGEKRADAAKQYLIALGVAGERMSVVSFGKDRPFDPRHNEEAWAKNRRAHFVVTAK